MAYTSSAEQTDVRSDLEREFPNPWTWALNWLALTDVVKFFTEISNDPMNRLPTIRPVPALDVVLERLLKVTLEEQQAFQRVFTSPDPLALCRMGLGELHAQGKDLFWAVRKVHAAMPKLMSPRPVLPEWDLTRLAPFESAVLRFKLGMIDGHDWTTEQLATKLGKSSRVIDKAFDSARMRLKGFKAPHLRKVAKVK